MSTFNTPLYLSQVPAAGRSQNVGFFLERDVAGKVRKMISSYTLLGTEATNDQIFFGILPKGAKVIAADSYFQTSSPGAVGAALTLNLGDKTVPTRWAGAIAAAAGGYFPLSGTPGIELVPVPIVADPNGNDSTVVGTLALATTPTAGKIITLFLSYLLP